MRNLALILILFLLIPTAILAADLNAPSVLVNGRPAPRGDSQPPGWSDGRDEDCVFYRGRPDQRLWSWQPEGQNDVDDLALGPDGILYQADTYHGSVGLQSLSGERLGTILVNGGGPGFAMNVAVHEGVEDPETGELVTPGYLYVRGGDVMDADPVEPFVYVYLLDGTFVRRIGTDIGDGLDEFTEDSEGPIGVDPAGNLLVVDKGTTEAGDHRLWIRRYLPGGVSPSVVAVHDPDAGHGHFFGPVDLVGTDTGRIFLLDFGLFNTEFPRLIEYGLGGGGALRSWDLEDIALAFGSPNDIVNDPVNQRLLLAVGTHVLEYSYDGEMTGFWDSGESSYIQALAYQPGEADFLALGLLPANYTPVLSVFGRGPMLVNAMSGDYQEITGGGQFALRADDSDMLVQCPVDTMQSVAADGVSTVIIRQNMPAPGTATVTLVSDRPHMAGAIAPLGGEPGPGPITVETVESEGQHVLAFQYRGPENYGPEGDLLAGEEQFRLDDLRMEWNPDHLDAYVTLSIPVMRCPVMFVHGLWSSPSAWFDFPGIRDDVRWQGLHRYVDYERSHGSYYSTNVTHLYHQIAEYRQYFLDRKIVASQFDFITHSMGGVLSRKLHDLGLGSGYGPANREFANLGQGHFNKILFFNTPHQGSPWANALTDLRDDLVDGTANLRQRAAGTVIFTLLKYVVGARESEIFGGAIDDLRDDSPALVMNNAAIPAHVHSGLGGFGIPEVNFNRGIAKLVPILTSLDPESCAQFGTNYHDMVVLDFSQEAYFSPANITDSYDSHCGAHMEVLKDDCLVAGPLAETFATAAVDDPFFESVIPAISPPGLGKSAEHFTLPEFAGRGFDLSTDGYTYPGGSLTITMTPREGFVCDTYILGFDGQAAVLPAGQNEVEFQIPDHWLGEKTVSAIALTDEGAVVDAPPLSLDISTWEPVTEIWTEADELVISEIGGTRVLRVFGTFYYGAVREIQGTDRVSFYPAAGDEAVYRALDDGTILAVAPGEGTLTVQAGSRQTTVTVRVLDLGTAHNPPHAQAAVVGNDSICGGFEVCLDAAGSHDLDELLGEVLSYSWDLDGDGRFDDLSGPAPCFTIDAAEEYISYLLKVEDETGNAAYAGGVLRPVYPGCVGVPRVGNPIPVESGDAWTVGSDGYLYHVQDDLGQVTRYDADGEMVDSVAQNPPMWASYNVAAAPDGSLYYIQWDRDPDGSGDFYHLLGHIAPDGTHTRSILQPAVGYHPKSGIGASASGFLYYIQNMDGFPYLIKMTTAGEVVLQGVMDLPDGMLNLRDIVCGQEGDVYVNFENNGDHTWDVAKMHEQDGQLTLDTSWSNGGLLDQDFHRIRGIALDEDQKLTLIMVPGPGQDYEMALFDAEGVLQGIRTHYADGTRMDPLAEIGSLGGGRFIFEDNDQLVITQVYGSGASAVPVDDTQPSEEDPGTTGLSTMSLSRSVTTGGNIDISFRLMEPGKAVELAIYDLRGARVRTLVQEALGAGVHSRRWDLRDDRGQTLPSGMYFARLKTSHGVLTRKITLLK